MGAYAQNLMLLLHEQGIGTCWKTPPYIFEPKVRKVFGVHGDEVIAFPLPNRFRRSATKSTA